MLTAAWAAVIVLCSSVDVSSSWFGKTEGSTRWTRAAGLAVGYLGVWETTSDPGGWHAHLRTPEISPKPTLSPLCQRRVRQLLLET